MDVRELDFDLPSELIAQEPPAERSAARLLWLQRESGILSHGCVAALPDLLRSGDLIVVNDTRVFPARLLGRRVPSGGAVECLLVRRLSSELPPIEIADTSESSSIDIGSTSETHPSVWEALMHPGQKLQPGARAVFEGIHTIHGEVIERRFFGRRVIRLWTDDGTPIDTAVDAIGHVPLPPYIKRDDRPDDRDRYQTVFARSRGSVAAPTAGLHFTPDMLSRLSARGIEIAELTLHVGYGTFQPVRVDRVEDHRVEPEQYEIHAGTAEAVNRALAESRRVIAIGTTTTRTLEAVAQAHAGRLVAGRGSTDLVIYPGFEFRAISGLLTNFHLPRSSLLMLVSAFGGRDRVRSAYDTAVAERYRFYSYGDAMLIL